MRRPRRSLTLVTAPAGEPVSVADAKAWLRIDDTASDVTLTQLVSAARLAAEEYLRRSLVTQSYKLTIDLCGSETGNWLGEGTYDLPASILYGGLPNVIELPKGPVQSVTAVTTYDTADTPGSYDAGNYHVDAAGARLVLNRGAVWPSGLRPVAACEILYVTGYGGASSVPQPIKTGILIHVATMFEQRGQCADAADLPPGTKQLFNQYRVMGDRRG